MVLVEEELVVIDLQTEGWPVIQTPYLVPLHSSAITCSHHVSAIPLKLWERVLAAGDLQSTHYSKKARTSFLLCLNVLNPINQLIYVMCEDKYWDRIRAVKLLLISSTFL